ncbi:nucleoside-diphosphate sugar epimerase/dehydratase [Pseudarthrobacter sp. H3Y2-7]|uniref:polysaccharide biosynthesis protein n=1 Tax=Pseudarthrobacter naphthalenicus TaxID=3031328 RepID=UPI0023B05B9D|nr:nucleoside-diphosphate sugar epimerase/dehydratase [Pseudarthrobacter sp. H3Y2-7]MDE8668141.1 nucleoside-diphosphate sugar epimerase/dehydratase [Pseudarthrobacter sp. H3Y2-7]
MLQYAVDAEAWVIAVTFAALFRFDFVASRIDWLSVGILATLAIVLQAVIGWVLSLYRGRHQHGAFHEAQTLLATVVSVAALLFSTNMIFLSNVGLPRSTALVALPVAFVIMGGSRHLQRIVSERRVRPQDSAERALIYGAGQTGAYLIKRMLSDPNSPYLPVGLVDDDPDKRHLRLSNVPVLGGGADLVTLAGRTDATALILCVARADANLIRDVSDLADNAGLRMMVMPLLSEILNDGMKLADLRDVAIEDVIGRQPVDTEVDSIAGYVAGKRVLVTGAGGSIGAELCRQLSRYNPQELIMLDRDETGLHGVQISISGHGLLNSDDVVLGDIRDSAALKEIFHKRRPEVVFHAAALKHLPMLEQYPEEAWKTNVLGTLNVLNAARSVGVKTFVNISTDKAANPISVLGQSKRTAERLTAWSAAKSGESYLSVRFGNVIGSRGSVLPTFIAQIEAGGPVTVTDPEVTRYFMTIPEACQLVIQAGAIGRPGEALILDMGSPIKILDVAKRVIASSGRSIEIVFTGLREGEKLHEELFGVSEHDERPFHPKVTHTAVPPLDPDNLYLERWPETGAPSHDAPKAYFASSLGARNE